METNSEDFDRDSGEVTRERIINDLRLLVRDAEGLMRATAEDLGDKTREARERLNGAVENAKETCRRLEDRAWEGARAGAKATDKLIREHPYQCLGATFGIGLLIGLLINRK